MKKVIQAAQVLSARTCDTGDGVRLVLLDEAGDEQVVVLPLDQLSTLTSWLEHAESLATGPDGPPAPIHQIERWTIRPEADEEHLVLGFKLTKGAEVNLRMHRSGAAAFVKALSSLLGRLLPQAASRARH
jgi:hypothetical protein